MRASMFVSLLQFGLGRRDCVGRNFALLEGPTLLALLFNRFNFALQPGYVMEASTHGFMQGLTHGLPVTITARR